MMNYYAVFGNPIQHSLSPVVHQLFAKQTHQDLVYHPICVPVNGFATALFDFNMQGGKGVNITAPFKEEAFSLLWNMHEITSTSCKRRTLRQGLQEALSMRVCVPEVQDADVISCTCLSRVSERALHAKAVNTICFQRDGSAFGDNTDGVGLLRDLIQNLRIAISHKHILILGAGGAVRGILGPLLAAHPAEIIIANRTVEKAKRIAHDFSTQGSITTYALEDLPQVAVDIVINTISSWHDIPLINASIINKHTFCYDLVYGQKITPFLSWAKKQGAVYVSDGLGMLVEQAAEAFYLWYHIKPRTHDIIEQLRYFTHVPIQ